MRRRLGRSALLVSPLALGTMQFGWTVADVEAMRILDAYVDAGGNLIETADMYGGDQNLQSYEGNKAHVGISEDVIGRWLRSRGCRDDVVLATKVGARVWDGPDGAGLSRAHIVRSAEESLRRLRTDAIDLYQAHWPDPHVAMEETLEAFAELIAAGKVRYFGTSNFAARGVLGPTLALGESRGVPPACEQLRCSLLHRQELMDAADELSRQGTGVIAFSPLAGGFLTGKYRRRAVRAPSVRAAGARRYMNDAGRRLVDAVVRIAAARGTEPAAVSLAWVLAQPHVAAAVVGANRPEQLHELAAAVDVRLDVGELDELTGLSLARSSAEFSAW